MHLFLPEQYQPQTIALFNVVAARLGAALPCARIEHVGASSIPGAVSKGDLDLCVIVSAELFASTLAALEQLGYQIKADTLRTDQLCMLESDSATGPDEAHAIQLIEAGSTFEFFITFRDALRASPAAVRQYNELKHAAAGLGVDEYRKAKRAFIDQILAAIGE